MAVKKFGMNLKKDPRSMVSASKEEPKEEPKVEAKTVPEAKSEAKPKGKVGRPKTRTEDVHKFPLAIPVSMVEFIGLAALKHGGNWTAYIVSLIRRDIEENREEYEKLRDFIGGQ